MKTNKNWKNIYSRWKYPVGVILGILLFSAFQFYHNSRKPNNVINIDLPFVNLVMGGLFLSSIFIGVIIIVGNRKIKIWKNISLMWKGFIIGFILTNLANYLLWNIGGWIVLATIGLPLMLSSAIYVNLAEHILKINPSPSLFETFSIYIWEIIVYSLLVIVIMYLHRGIKAKK